MSTVPQPHDGFAVGHIVELRTGRTVTTYESDRLELEDGFGILFGRPSGSVAPCATRVFSPQQLLRHVPRGAHPRGTE